MRDLVDAALFDVGSKPICPLLICPRLDNLRRALRETVVALEATRRSFKSKQLEVVRTRLLGVLAEL
jgi:hypothetical protein